MSTPRSIFAAKLAELPDVALADAKAFERRGNWGRFFRDRIGAPYHDRLVFEIGCNDAALLTRIAQKHPHTAFVGIDWKFKAIYDAASRVSQLGLRNVALVRGRAQDVARYFGAGEVDEAWVFHPDPCDKPNELKNRLFAEPFLSDLHGVLRDGRSTLTLKTDHPGYYQWALALLGLPEPAAFEPARAGFSSPVGTPRVRPRDLMSVENLPSVNAIVRAKFEATTWSADFWGDTQAQARLRERAWVGERTSFEERFVRKRMPIYLLDLRKR